MKLQPEEITREVCRRCGKCCYVSLSVNGDERTLELLDVILGDRLKVDTRTPCECGCGVEKFTGTLREECPELVERNGLFECRRYENRPRFCREYNCVIWALVSGHAETEQTRRAEEILRALREG